MNKIVIINTNQRIYGSDDVWDVKLTNLLKKHSMQGYNFSLWGPFVYDLVVLTKLSTIPLEKDKLKFLRSLIAMELTKKNDCKPQKYKNTF